MCSCVRLCVAVKGYVLLSRAMYCCGGLCITVEGYVWL